MPRIWDEEDSERLAAMVHANSDWFKLQRAWPYLTQSRIENQLRQLVKRPKQDLSQSPLSRRAYRQSNARTDDRPGNTSHLPNWHRKHSTNNMQSKWTPREYCILAACIYRGVGPLHAAVRFYNRSVSGVQSKYRAVKNEMYVEAARIALRKEEIGNGDDDEDGDDNGGGNNDDGGDDDDGDGDDDDASLPSIQTHYESQRPRANRGGEMMEESARHILLPRRYRGRTKPRPAVRHVLSPSSSASIREMGMPRTSARRLLYPARHIPSPSSNHQGRQTGEASNRILYGGIPYRSRPGVQVKLEQ